MPVVITDIPRPPEALLQAFQELDVATVHEAQGRKGYWLLTCVRSIVRPRLSALLSHAKWLQETIG